MALTVDLNRPAAAQTNAITPSLDIGTPTEVDTTEEESIFIPFNLQSVDPASFTVASCTTTNASTTVTATGGVFNTAGGHGKGVKVGDAVSGTGIAGGTTVATVATNGNSITLSQAATASGTVTLTFDPPSLSEVGVYALKIKHSKDANKSTSFQLDVTLYKYDGSLRGTAPTENNATSSSRLTPASGNLTIDLDAVLTNVRVARS